MPRFFVPDEGFSGEFVKICGGDAHHISYSLRMATGDKITVANMHGDEFSCELVSFSDECVTARIIEKACGNGEMPVKVHIYQAFPKGDKLETIVQKSVELGAYDITPFECERCIRRPPAERIPRLIERLSKIAEEAAKQCGRGMIPAVRLPLSFKAALAGAAESSLALFCFEGGGTVHIKKLLEENPDVSDISVVIGPEGGFSPAEAMAAEAAGLSLTGLGGRILRTETASSYALACISYRYELK